MGGRLCTRGGVIRDSSRHTAARGLIYFIDSTHVNGLAIIGIDLFHEVAIVIVDELHRLAGQSVCACMDFIIFI